MPDGMLKAFSATRPTQDGSGINHQLEDLKSPVAPSWEISQPAGEITNSEAPSIGHLGYDALNIDT